MMEHLSSNQFSLYTKPVSAGRPQVFKSGGVGDTKQYREFKKNIEQVMERDLSPVDIQKIMDDIAKGNGYKVHIVCYYERKNKEFWNTPMIIVPDVDNLIKGVFDQVLGRLGLEDSRIFSATIDKMYGKENKINCFVDTYQIKEYKSKKNVSGKSRKRRKKGVTDEEKERMKKVIEQAKARLNNG